MFTWDLAQPFSKVVWLNLSQRLLGCLAQPFQKVALYT